MDHYWQRLGIGPTDDLVTIKRAYAKALKCNRPDDDPAAYQQLREAYDWAQGFARWAREHPDWRSEWADEADAQAGDGAGALAQDDAALGETSAAEGSATVPVHEVELSEPIADPRPTWLRIGVDPVAALMPPAPVPMPPGGEAAGTPLRFASVCGELAPDLVPRWLRRAVPADEEADALPVGAFAQLNPIEVDDVLQALHDWCDVADDHDARAERLVSWLHQLPFGEQTQAQLQCARFVLEGRDLPPRLVLALTHYFDWGQDFRLEQLIGDEAAFELYDCIERAREDLAELGPRGLKAAQQRFARLRASARCKASGQTWRFLWRVVLSPFAHLRDIRQPDAEPVLAVEALPWQSVSNGVHAVFNLSLVAIACALASVHGADSLFPGMPVWVMVTATLGVGILGYLALAEWPTPMLTKALTPRGATGLGRWLLDVRTRSRAYWIAILVLVGVLVAVSAAPEILAAHGWPRASIERLAGATSLAASGLVLIALWPRGEAWAPFMLPLYAVLFTVLALIDGLQWYEAVPVAAAWLLLAQMVAVCYPALAERIFHAPFGLIRPSGLRWLLFIVLIKGVVVFYALLLLLSPPLWCCVFARDEGWPKAWLALLIALGLWSAGLLPINALSFLAWWMLSLFALSRLSRLSDWLLSRGEAPAG